MLFVEYKTQKLFIMVRYICLYPQLSLIAGTLGRERGGMAEISQSILGKTEDKYKFLGPKLKEHSEERHRDWKLQTSEKRRRQQQRSLTPRSGVFQMVMRKWKFRKTGLKTSSHTHVTEGKFAGRGVRPWTNDPEGKGYGLETKSPEPTQLPLLFLKLSAGEGREKWGEFFH